MSLRKILVEISSQTARIFENEKQIRVYSISTSRFGIGTEAGSNKTPLGQFKVNKKIGDGAAVGSVFKGRVFTGQICGPGQATWQSDEDFVLTRILWLEGAEDSNSNTLQRYIYLHGTNQEHLIGTPASHGCIRFKNRDVIEVYDLLSEGSDVVILP